MVFVSVPSSSGHVFRQTKKKKVRKMFDGFSPLFIGACVSTARRASGKPCSPPVSVPSSSGHVFRPQSERDRPVHGKYVSVPSSSGHVFRQHCGPCRPSWTQSFQSPLHRGMCFDDKNATDALGLLRVSVPSSSGHVFRPEQSLVDNPSNPGFSPLFIGACVSTSLKTSCPNGHP